MEREMRRVEIWRSILSQKAKEGMERKRGKMI